MRILTCALLPSLGWMALASGLPAEEIKRDFHETFDVSEGARLRLRHGDGDVDIRPWDKNVLDIEVHYHADISSFGLGRRRHADFTVDFSQRGDLISVVGRRTGHGGFQIGFFSSRRYEYTYTIRGPAYLELELEGDDGDVRIADWRGNVECTLDDGDVTFDGVEAERIELTLEDGDFEAHGLKGDLFLSIDDGDVYLSDCEIGWGRLRLEDGDLEVEDCRGDFDIAIDDGNVRFRGLRAKELDIRGNDGDIFVDLLAGTVLDVLLETDDGRVELVLESGISASFSITTDDGRITLDLPSGSEIEQRDESASGKIGSGEGRIRVRTEDGSVLLRELG